MASTRATRENGCVTNLRRTLKVSRHVPDGRETTDLAVTAPPRRVLELQRAFGNQAVAGALQRRQLAREDEEVHRNTSGEQLIVQQKMAAITQWLKERDFADEEESDHVPGDEEETDGEMTDRYAKDLAINGLCGGWSTLFMRQPDWVEPVYNAVRSWRRPRDLSDSEALLHFEEHLAKTTKFRGAEHVVLLVRRAYDEMAKHEPSASYDKVPLWIDEVELGQTLPGNGMGRNVVQEETKIVLRGRNAAKLVCERLAALTSADKPGQCMAHVESDIHHMAVRVQKTVKGGRKPSLLITVVETEKRGIVKVESWDKAERILDGWLHAEEGLKDVALRTATSGF
jgi:hypothetical protein